MNREETDFLKENGYWPNPKMVQFEITLRCPFNCSQCYKKKLKNVDIDFDYLCKLIEKSVSNGVSLLTLNGGEPLLYPRIKELLVIVGKTGVDTNIFSSGYNLDRDIIKLIKNYDNIHICISLNGSNEDINSLSRQGFDVSISAINQLRDSHVDYGINWVARHDNICDFPNMLTLCVDNRVSKLSITSNKLTGNEEYHSPITSSDIQELAQYINERVCKIPLIQIESCFSILSTKVNGSKNGYTAHCYAGISNCTVNCDGTFQPCTHLKYPEAFESMELYWHNSTILKKLRDNLPNKLELCNSCKNKSICSFCRAMSIETYQDITSSIKDCPCYSQ